MLCPKCGLDGRISKVRYVVENDTTADAETELYCEQDIVCENERCGNYKIVFETMRIPMDIG